MKLLLVKGARVDAEESRKGQTALMWAAAEGHSEVVNVLLEHGASPGDASKGGFTPLMFAAQKGDAKSVVSLLAAGGDVNHALPTGQSALELALIGHREEVAGILLDHDAKVNTSDSAGMTPLHAAAQAGSVELVKRMLAKGADPNARTAKTPPPAAGASPGFFRQTPGELTPLHLAAKGNHEAVMRALIAAGADPKLKGQDGTTLLISAAGSGRLGVVKYAWELDPDIDAVTKTGSTAVHAAVFAFQASSEVDVVEVVKFLAAHGADVDVKDARGRTPIAIAKIFPLDAVIDALQEIEDKRHPLRIPELFGFEP